MSYLFLSALVFTAIFCIVAVSSRSLGQHGADEERAHAAALARRNRTTKERRREERLDVSRVCTAAVLGLEETQTSCRVLNISKSGMRIAVADTRFAANAQVVVEWETGFFVGEVCYTFSKDAEQVYGLRLVSTNCEG